MNRTLPYLLSLLGLASITSASAQELTTTPPSESPAPTSEEVYVLDDFVVSTADDKGYYSANSISATRTNELVKNTPITLTVVNEQLMEDLNILNDQDLDQVTASVSREPDGFSENRLRIRGFRSLTQRYDLFWRELERDGYNIQRADIVKGANSLMYGQADPGGLINSVPKMAQHNKNFTRIKGTVGNKDHVRAEFDANYVVNDDLAVRFMGMDMSRDLDQLYEYSNKTGGTVELSYRPSNKTHLRAHLEHMDLDQNLAPGMFKSTSGDKRFVANSPQDDISDADPSYSLGTYRNEFIYSPDAAKLVPDEIIADLRLNQAFADRFNGIPELDNNNNPTGDFITGSGDTTVTRDDLRRIWSTGINQDDRYSVTGPDKYNKRKGDIFTADWTQQLSDAVQFKLAVNHEDVDHKSRARDGYSSGRVLSSTSAQGDIDAFEPYVKTYWRRQEGRSQADALKATLLYEFDSDESYIMPGASKHKLLLGLDYDKLHKTPKMWEQVRDNATLETNAANEPVYYTADDLQERKFSLSDGFGPEVPHIGFTDDESEWKLRQDNEFESKTKSAWFAFQSEFLDGRLRSLFGLRYDDIDIKYSLRDYKINNSLVDKGPDDIDPKTGKIYARWKQKVYVDPVTGERRAYTNDDVATQIEGATASYQQVSPTLGALYWLNSEFGLFANYARSIQTPTGIDVSPTGEVIPPVYGEGYEYGLRFDLFEGKLNGQIAAFYIEKENDDIVNYDFRLEDVYPYSNEDYRKLYLETVENKKTVYKIANDILPGKQVPGDMSRAEGVECEFYYNPNRNLSFIVSYTYNNLDAIKINENVNPRFAQVWGQAPHNALLIGRYKFTSGALKGLTVGANQSFRSSSSIGEWYIEESTDPITNASQGTWHEVKFDPEYVTSAFLNYERKLGKGRGVPVLNLGLRVNNLFDDTDLINRNKGAFHRASRQYLLSASLRF